jgi:hypothetical protein
MRHHLTGVSSKAVPCFPLLLISLLLGQEETGGLGGPPTFCRAEVARRLSLRIFAITEHQVCLQIRVIARNVLIDWLIIFNPLNDFRHVRTASPSIHVYTHNNSTTVEQIFIKFGVDVMPLILFNFLQSVIPMSWLLKIMRQWDDPSWYVITHDPLWWHYRPW